MNRSLRAPDCAFPVFAFRTDRRRLEMLFQRRQDDCPIDLFTDFEHQLFELDMHLMVKAFM